MNMNSARDYYCKSVDNELRSIFSMDRELNKVNFIAIKYS